MLPCVLLYKLPRGAQVVRSTGSPGRHGRSRTGEMGEGEDLRGDCRVQRGWFSQGEVYGNFPLPLHERTSPPWTRLLHEQGMLAYGTVCSKVGAGSSCVFSHGAAFV